MKRTKIIALVTIFLLFLIGCTQGTQQNSQEVEVTRIVEATRLVEVTREVEVTRKVEVTKLVIVTPTQQIPTITPTLSAVAPLDARSSIFVDGNASPKLDAGEPGKLTVVLAGKYNGYSIPVIIRNYTPNDYIRVEVTGSAYSPDDTLIATGGGQFSNPNLIHPGEITMTHIYLGSDIELPENTKFEYEVTGVASWSENASHENIRDLMITEHNLISKRIVGFLENPYDVTVTGPISVSIYCFNENDQLTDFYDTYTDKDTAGPDETIPFQVDIDSDQCAKYLIGASGFTDTTESSIYPDYSSIPTKTPQPVADLQESTTPTRTLDASEIEAVRQVFLATTSEALANFEDVAAVNLVRFKDDKTLEIELKSNWASKDRQPMTSYDVASMIASGLCTDEGKQLLSQMGINEPTLELTTYSVNGDFRYQSETTFATLMKLFNKSISYEEWVSEANAGFR